MRKLILWMAITSLLCLTVSLIPSKESRAKPQYAPLYNAYDLIAEVNALRASRGLPAYNADSVLMQIAQTHSDYQASIGSTTHFGADGSRPYQRALAAGYPVAGDLSAGGFFSENIQAGSGLTPAGAVNRWMGDAPHQDTMLSLNLQDVGAGVSIDGGVTYYTLDAGSRSGATINYTPPSGATGIPGTPVEFIQPVVTSTPLADGTIVHEVQSGQALWTIALAYGTTIEDIKARNALRTNDIFVGQKLIVRIDTPSTSTPEPPTVTVTIGVPSSTATLRATSTATVTSTPLPASPTARETVGWVVLSIIIGALGIAGALTWLSAKKPV
jgi:LysM repeat protein